MKRTQPLVLHIPARWLHYTQPLQYLLALELSWPTSMVHSLAERFAFRNDEKRFVKELLSRKKNLWCFRTNQQKFCGDFVIIDMSSPCPKKREVYVLDLKRGARLKSGGGGAGIQFKNARLAVEEIARKTETIDKDTSYELLTGDREEILAYLGISYV